MVFMFRRIEKLINEINDTNNLIFSKEAEFIVRNFNLKFILSI
jgi:hypothetical protein